MKLHITSFADALAHTHVAWQSAHDFVRESMDSFIEKRFRLMTSAADAPTHHRPAARTVRASRLCAAVSLWLLAWQLQASVITGPVHNVGPGGQAFTSIQALPITTPQADGTGGTALGPPISTNIVNGAFNLQINNYSGYLQYSFRPPSPFVPPIIGAVSSNSGTITLIQSIQLATNAPPPFGTNLPTFFLVAGANVTLGATGGVTTISATGGGSATNALINGPGGIKDASLITNVQPSAVVGLGNGAYLNTNTGSVFHATNADSATLAADATIAEAVKGALTNQLVSQAQITGISSAISFTNGSGHFVRFGPNTAPTISGFSWYSTNSTSANALTDIMDLNADGGTLGLVLNYGSFVGPLVGNVTGNLTGSVTATGGNVVTNGTTLLPWGTLTNQYAIAGAEAPYTFYNLTNTLNVSLSTGGVLVYTNTATNGLIVYLVYNDPNWTANFSASVWDISTNYPDVNLLAQYANNRSGTPTTPLGFNIWNEFPNGSTVPTSTLLVSAYGKSAPAFDVSAFSVGASNVTAVNIRATNLYAPLAVFNPTTNSTVTIQGDNGVVQTAGARLQFNLGSTTKSNENLADLAFQFNGSTASVIEPKVYTNNGGTYGFYISFAVKAVPEWFTRIGGTFWHNGINDYGQWLVGWVEKGLGYNSFDSGHMVAPAFLNAFGQGNYTNGAALFLSPGLPSVNPTPGDIESIGTNFLVTITNTSSRQITTPLITKEDITNGTASFAGSGASLTSLNAGNFASGNTSTSNKWVGRFVGDLEDGTNAVALANLGPNSPASSNNVALISALTPANAALLTGTVADARLSGNVPLLNGNNNFTGANTFSYPPGFSDSYDASKTEIYSNTVTGAVNYTDTNLNTLSTGNLVKSNASVTIKGTGQFNGSGAGITNTPITLGVTAIGSNGSPAAWMLGLDASGKTTTNAVPSGGGGGTYTPPFYFDPAVYQIVMVGLSGNILATTFGCDFLINVGTWSMVTGGADTSFPLPHYLGTTDASSNSISYGGNNNWLMFSTLNYNRIKFTAGLFSTNNVRAKFLTSAGGDDFLQNGLHYTVGQAFVYCSSNSPDWFAFAGNFPFSTNIDTGVTADANDHTFEFVQTRTNQLFIIDGTNYATAIMPQISTNTYSSIGLGVCTLDAVAKKIRLYQIIGAMK